MVAKDRHLTPWRMALAILVSAVLPPTKPGHYEDGDGHNHYQALVTAIAIIIPRDASLLGFVLDLWPRHKDSLQAVVTNSRVDAAHCTSDGGEETTSTSVMRSG